MFNRRRFLQQSSLVTLAPLVPAFVTQTTCAAPPKKEARILIVIELGGGNDGLNTVIPYTDENYGKYRRKLRIEKKDVIPLNDSLGLHPAMKAAAELFDDGQLSIIPGVGYPNPSRSHFQSMATWHSARLDPLDHTGQGWLGRAGDQQRKTTTTTKVSEAVYVGDGTIPAAIVGRRTNSIAVSSPGDLTLALDVPSGKQSGAGEDLQSFVRNSVASSFETAERFSAATDDSVVDGAYPNYQLAEHLKLVSRIIRLGDGTRVFYVSQPGYDTHSGQLPTHQRLLTQFSRSLKAFLQDMKLAGLSERVMVLAFSEFGRRVEENVSVGTDHGTSGPVFVAGEGVKAGILSEYPSLAKLADGDLEATVDFRRVYASVLSDWLGLDSKKPLGGVFDPLKVTA